MIFTSHSVKQTQELAKKIALKYKDGGIFALSGPLGAGKTTFTQGFAQGLGIKDKLLSPTFVLMREYKIPGNAKGKLFHIDLYRLDQIEQIDELGISEILSNPKNIILIEWAEKLGTQLPKETILVIIKHLSENSREIEIREN